MKEMKIKLVESDLQAIYGVIFKLISSDDTHLNGLAYTLEHRLFGKPKTEE